jgi:hypothetical protein
MHIAIPILVHNGSKNPTNFFLSYVSKNLHLFWAKPLEHKA